MADADLPELRLDSEPTTMTFAEDAPTSRMLGNTITRRIARSTCGLIFESIMVIDGVSTTGL
jgi:hypothetical protein